MLIAYLLRGDQEEFDRILSILDSYAFYSYVLYFSPNEIHKIENWEGFYKKLDKMYYKNHRIIIKEN